MNSKEQDIHFKKIREIHVRRLQVLELQAAQFGINTPPHIVLEIEDIKEKIRLIELQLKKYINATEHLEHSQKLSSTQVNINGNVSGNIIIGNKNEVKGS